MHKKIETDLISLAKQISKMKSGDDVAHFQDKARALYEKLTVLTVVNKYFSESEKTEETASLVETKKEIIPEKNAIATSTPVVESIPKTPSSSVKSTLEGDNKKEETAKLVNQTVKTIKQEAVGIVNKIQNQKPQDIHKDPIEKRASLDEEMKDSIPADVAANMFQKATNLEKSLLTKKTKLSEIIPRIPKLPEIPKVNIATKQAIPTVPKTIPAKPISSTSINDSIHKQKLQIGLNDRIAFVKHLFNFSQEDFNRVLSQLNSFGTEQECKDFLYNSIKPEYDWSEHLEYEERLVSLIERKFL